ncbi:MAG: glutamate 5-kinase [Actinobacteria bacterium]|nr:glutamate 5-kinase [Actinomycetota bacterium]MCB9389039.1 glutamate 5-kinase [Acidimicrobiia bacterium]
MSAGESEDPHLPQTVASDELQRGDQRWKAARAVIKVGTSSITDQAGRLKPFAIEKLCNEIAEARETGHEIVLVTSGAITAGVGALNLKERPTRIRELQAVAAVGQPLLMGRYQKHLSDRGVPAGQVLLTPYDFMHRPQYLHARETLRTMLGLGIVPIVNENDTVADDAIRFGDNDRIAAIVANLVDAQRLVLLTDIAGVFDADPRANDDASLIEEIVEFDPEVVRAAGGAGTVRGSGGMASKIAAARMASWSGVSTTIMAGDCDDAVLAGLSVRPPGTLVRARTQRLSARKLWIAFGMASRGRIVIDDGARGALLHRGGSLLAPGIVAVSGSFNVDDAVDLIDRGGDVIAKGLVRRPSSQMFVEDGGDAAGADPIVVHRDDLVIIPEER